MPLAYVQPEEAFEVRIQCTEEQIQRHCDAAPENDRRDFDDRGRLQVPVYHVYKNGNINNRMTYWYTFDEAEDRKQRVRYQRPTHIRRRPTSRGCSRARVLPRPGSHRKQSARPHPNRTTKGNAMKQT